MIVGGRVYSKGRSTIPWNVVAVVPLFSITTNRLNE